MSEIKRVLLQKLTMPIVEGTGLEWPFKVGHTVDSLVKDWPFEQITPNIRLYYRLMEVNPSAKGKDKRYGFYFCSVDWAGSLADSDDIWLSSEVYLGIWFHGTAYYDGIRHLYLGDKESSNEGYINYGDVRDMIKVLKALDRMEQRYLEPDMHSRA